MALEVTLRDLVGSTFAFNQLADIKLRGKLSFKIARVIKAVQPELDTYNEEVKKIREVYYEEVEVEPEGELPPDVSSEPKMKLELVEGKSFDDFQKEVDELLDSKISLSVEPLDVKPFDTLEISPGVLTGILWLFEE